MYLPVSAVERPYDTEVATNRARLNQYLVMIQIRLNRHRCGAAAALRDRRGVRLDECAAQKLAAAVIDLGTRSEGVACPVRAKHYKRQHEKKPDS